MAAADSAFAKAVIEGGLALSGLALDTFARLQREVAVDRMLKGHEQSHRQFANADDPLADVRPDRDAARKQREDALKALEAYREKRAALPKLLASVVAAVAALTNETRPAAFKRLMA